MIRSGLVCLLAAFAAAGLSAQSNNANPVKVSSPNGEITFLLFAGESASPSLQYAVEFHGKRLLDRGDLGLKFVGQPDLGPGMHVTATQPESADETYTIPVGKTSSVRNHYNGVRADLVDGSGRKLSIEARVFDDGLGFRYVVPEQPGLKDV